MSERQRLRPSFLALNLVFSVLTVAVAASVWWPIYESSAFIVMAAATIGIAAVVGVLGYLFRWNGFVVILAMAVAFFLFGVQLALPGQAIAGVLPSGEGLIELGAAVGLAWKQLVTILLPVGSYQGLLVPAYISILVTTVLSVTIATRATWAEYAVVPPILLLVLGIALGPAAAWYPILIGLAVLVLALIWMVCWRHERHRQRQREHADAVASVAPSRRERRRSAAVSVISASGIIAAAAVGGIAMATALPAAAERDVIRSHVEQPFNPRDYPSPLSSFRAYLQPDQASAELFEISGLPADGRIRLATLDTYDGVVFTVGTAGSASESGTFVRVPYRLDQGADGRVLELDVTIGGYSGIWVPGMGQLREISFTGQDASANTASYFYNDNTGSSAVINGLAVGDEYRMGTIALAVPSDAEIAELEPGTAELPAFVDVPAVLRERLAAYTDGVRGDGAKLLAMLDGLKEDGYISHGIGPEEPRSRSGHGIDRIEELLTAKPMIGDQEQYAVTAALMARELGFPARVVVGFAPADVGAGGPVSVHGSDISAWIEVQSSDGSWLTIDPNPAVRDIPEKEPEDPTKVSRPQSVVQPPVTENEDDTEQTPATDSEQNENQEESVLLRILLIVATVLAAAVVMVAVLAAPFLAVIVAKLRRRSLRRKRSAPADRIRGGWQEFHDAAVDYGVEPPPSATRKEVASAVGGKRAIALAAVTDRATFSTERPSHEDADRVWLAVDELRHSLGAGRTKRQRLRAATSLRSLDIGKK